MRDEIAELARATRRALGGSGAVHHGGGVDEPRFELFHAAASICSQKVRAVLAHHALPYREHGLSIFHGQTYLPDYVRLRMAGCARHGGALASHHGGSTSTEAGGCDGAVVPTLIDWEAGEVIVDSRRICLHLDRAGSPSRSLRPIALADTIDRQVAIVDHLPNYQMLMGRTVDDGEAAATREGVGAALSHQKVAWCDRYLHEHPDDDVLVRAYSAKRAKELSAAVELFSPAAMRDANARAKQSLVDLDQVLRERTTPWLHAEMPTMSDLFWAIELLRMRNVGIAPLWEDDRLPHVAAYLDAAEHLDAVREAVTEWPGATF